MVAVTGKCDRDISVVVPFHNEEQHIEKCVQALLSQDCPSSRYEIIMVDNGSTDRSPDIVKRYPDVKLISEKRPGSYAARNRGIAYSNSTIIAFTDADCVPSVDWLQTISEAMTSQEVAILLGSRQFAIESLALSIVADYQSTLASYVFSNRTKDIYYGYTNNMAVRRAVFRKLGAFPEIRRGGDTVFVQRAVNQLSCDAVCYAPQVSVRHLEITSLWSYYRKLLLYGRSNRLNSLLGSGRPLTKSERLLILRRAFHGEDESLSRLMAAFVLLAVAGIFYRVGRWSATWAPTRPKGQDGSHPTRDK